MYGIALETISSNGLNANISICTLCSSNKANTYELAELCHRITLPITHIICTTAH